MGVNRVSSLSVANRRRPDPQFQARPAGPSAKKRLPETTGPRGAKDSAIFPGAIGRRPTTPPACGCRPALARALARLTKRMAASMPTQIASRSAETRGNRAPGADSSKQSLVFATAAGHRARKRARKSSFSFNAYSASVSKRRENRSFVGHGQERFSIAQIPLMNGPDQPATTPTRQAAVGSQRPPSWT